MSSLVFFGTKRSYICFDGEVLLLSYTGARSLFVSLGRLLPLASKPNMPTYVVVFEISRVLGEVVYLAWYMREGTF